MIKHIILGFSFLASTYISAQDIDPLFLSQTDMSGTARFRSMSGAFGALGGDLSAIIINPAGSVNFANNQLGFTLTNYHINNKSNYQGTLMKSTESVPAFNQIGGVLVFQDTSKAYFKKITVGLTYEKTNNFNNSIATTGINPNTSISSFFVNKANGTQFSNLQLQNGETIRDAYSDIGSALGANAQIAFLGFQGFIIDPENSSDPNNTSYSSTNKDIQNVTQLKSILTSGRSGIITANIATEINKYVSIGLNVNSHFLEYNNSTLYYEENYNSNSTGNLDRINYKNNVRTLGNGVSYNLGLLTKFDQFRFGLAYESSTYYELNDDYTHTLTFSSEKNEVITNETLLFPNTLMTLPTYELRTPNKVSFSGAYIFGNKGLISIDYGIRNFKRIQVSDPLVSDVIYFNQLNQNIETKMQNATELRIGAEYRIENVSLRGGIRYDESPYKKQYTSMGDLYGISGGLGFNFGKTRIDLAYSRTQRSYTNPFMETGLTSSYNTKTVLSNITATVIFQL